MDFSIASASRSLREFYYQSLFAAGPFPGLSADEMAAQSAANIAEHRRGSFTEEALRTAFLDFEDRTQKLYRALGPFEFPEGNLSNHYRMAFVSDSERLLAAAELDATPTNYLVDIDRIATAQTYRSKLLRSDETSAWDEGSYPFTLTVGDETYNLSVGVKRSGLHPDTNKDILRRLARVISAADDSIEAFVTETSRKVYSTLSAGLKEDVVYLTIRSKNSGDAVSFSLEDSSGEIVSALHLAHLVEGGTSLAYRINSIPSTSQTNQVSLDDSRLNLTFLETTSTFLETTVWPGLDPLKEKIVEIFTLYNSYIRWIDENRRYFKASPKLGILDSLKAISDDLEDLGIAINADGTIALEEKFDVALVEQIDDIRQALTGDEGFLTLMKNILTDILRNGGDEYMASASENFIDRLV